VVQEALKTTAKKSPKGRRSTPSKSSVKKRKAAVIPPTPKSGNKKIKLSDTPMPSAHKKSQPKSASKEEQTVSTEDTTLANKISTMHNNANKIVKQLAKNKSNTTQPNRNFYPSLGKGKTLWTDKEIKTLVQGVKKFGVGHWAEILKFPGFKANLVGRTSTNLKDKWRTLRKQLDTE